MRQIEMMVQFITMTVLHKDSIHYEIIDETNLSKTDSLYKELCGLIAKHRICEAENLLYENLNEGNTEYLEMALDFYQTINQMTDDELEKCNFSREEINDGINEMLRRFHIAIDIAGDGSESHTKYDK